MFWRWNFEIEICNLQLKLSFVFPLPRDVDLKIEIALCMNDFLCSSIFTDIPFSLLCLFFSLCYSLCLLPFSGVSFVFLNVDWAMGVIGITNGDESFRPAWRWDLRCTGNLFVTLRWWPGWSHVGFVTWFERFFVFVQKLIEQSSNGLLRVDNRCEGILTWM